MVLLAFNVLMRPKEALQYKPLVALEVNNAVLTSGPSCSKCGEFFWSSSHGLG